jgi:hypothetical protein
MKKRIATLLLTVAMAAALFTGPALARDYDHDGDNDSAWRSAQGWRQPPAYQGHGNRYGYGYPYSGQAYGNQPGRYAYAYPYNQPGRYAYAYPYSGQGYRPYGYPYSGYRGYPSQGWKGWHHGHNRSHHDRDHDGD